MPLREFFHAMLTVDDFDTAERFFADLLSPVTYAGKHWSDLDKRWASLARVGDDFTLEILDVSDDPEHAHLALPKFVARHGQHWHSLTWFVVYEDMQEVLDRLRTNGVRVVDQRGQLYPAEGEAEAAKVIFTHPKDTFGLIELFGMPATGYAGDPYFEDGWSSSSWRDEHPLGIRRTSHFTNIVSDLDQAVRVFGLLGGDPFHRSEDDEARRAYVFVGNQSVVELAEPKPGPSRLAADQAGHGDILHCVTFAVGDLDAVEKHASSLGVRVAERRDDTLWLDPDDCFGALFAFTTASIPGDPRGAA